MHGVQARRRSRTGPRTIFTGWARTAAPSLSRGTIQCGISRRRGLDRSARCSYASASAAAHVAPPTQRAVKHSCARPCSASVACTASMTGPRCNLQHDRCPTCAPVGQGARQKKQGNREGASSRPGSVPVRDFVFSGTAGRTPKDGGRLPSLRSHYATPGSSRHAGRRECRSGRPTSGRPACSGAHPARGSKRPFKSSRAGSGCNTRRGRVVTVRQNEGPGLLLCLRGTARSS